MTHTNRREDIFDSLDTRDMLAVNRTCDEFENQWRETGDASLSAFAAQLQFDSVAATEVALCELISIDVTYRRKHQMDVTTASYHDQFPQLQYEALSRLIARPTMEPDPSQTDTVSNPAQPSPPEKPVFHQGQKVGDYLIDCQIGNGGMGQVYRATHELMGRRVAIKVLSNAISRDPNAVQRFQREVQLLAEMQHTNMVTAWDARYDDDKLLLVTEWIDGNDLHEQVKMSGALPAADVVDIAIQAAAGLHHAHTKGFVHRDVKPSNLMLDPSGTIKILDLGLAKLRQDNVVFPDEQSLTSNHQFIGTAAYLSPEQARNPAAVDERTDIYSLGCTLVFLMTGRAPYSGDTAMDTLLQHTSDQPIDLKSRFHNRSIPRSVSQLIGLMMEKSVDRRPSSMQEVHKCFVRIRDQAQTETASGKRLKLLVTTGSICALAMMLLVFAISSRFFDQDQRSLPSNIPASQPNDTSKIDTGLVFNGHSSYARVGEFRVPPTGSITIDSVVTPDYGPMPSNIVTWGGPNLFALFVAPNNCWGAASLRNGQSYLQVSEQPFQIGATYRVTCAWQDGGVSLWVDGQPIRTRPEVFQLAPSDVSLCFGGLPSDLRPRGQGTRYFTGKIHHVSLHQGNVLAIGSPLPRRSEMASSATLVFNFDESAGQTTSSEDNQYQATLFDCRWIHP